MKFLIIGLGSIGQRHVRNLKTLLGSEVEISAYRVRGLSDVLTEKFEIQTGAQLEDTYGIRIFENLDQALQQPPDAAFICNPTSLHLETALTVARAGCHLFIEKALSHIYEDVDELIQLVDEKNLVALVGYQMRFHPCLQRLESLLNKNAIGPIVTVQIEVAEYLPGSHPYEDYRQRYASRADLGGGVVISQSHELDYIYWLFGMPRRLFSIGGRLLDFDIDVEDTVSTLLEYEREGRRMNLRLHQDYIQKPARRTCEVVGVAGRITVDLQANRIRHYGSEGTLIEERVFLGFERNQLFLDELDHFLACLKRQQQPAVSVRAGAQSLRLALAIKKSLSKGQPVELD